MLASICDWWNSSTPEIHRACCQSEHFAVFIALIREIYHISLLQGDGNIRYYEVSDAEPYFTFLNEYRSSSPQRGLGVMPKRGLDVTTCEIYRFYKLHNNNFVEPIAMTVPRRVSSEQNSIFWILLFSHLLLSVWVGGGGAMASYPQETFPVVYPHTPPPSPLCPLTVHVFFRRAILLSRKVQLSLFVHWFLSCLNLIFLETFGAFFTFETKGPLFLSPLTPSQSVTFLCFLFSVVLYNWWASLAVK